MYFRANNSISLTLITQEVSSDKTAVGLALTHSGDQGTKAQGVVIAEQRLRTALSNGDHIGNWGAGSFSYYTDYIKNLQELLKSLETCTTSSENRHEHKSLFNNPIKYLKKYFGHPDIETTSSAGGCAACGSPNFYEQFSNSKDATEFEIEKKYGINLPEEVNLCKTCFCSRPWIGVATDIAIKIKTKRKKIVEEACKVDPNTKMIGYTASKVGDKHVVCVMFETDKEPEQFVVDKYYLSPQIIMATSTPIPYTALG